MRGKQETVTGHLT